MNRRGLLITVLVLVAASVAAAVAAGHRGSPGARSCGEATLRGPVGAAFSGSTSLRCFALAVTQCQTASIRVTESGVDGGDQFTATVEPGTPCRARFVSNSYSFDDSKGPKATTECTVGATAVKVSFRCPDFSDDIPTS